MRRGLSWIAVIAGASVAGCSVYDSSLLLSRGVKGSDAAGGNAGAGGTGGAPDDAATDDTSASVDAPEEQHATCSPIKFPTPPLTSTGTASIEFVVAMRAINFGDLSASDAGVAGYAQMGYDLDGYCTGPGLDGASCKEPPYALNQSGVSHDDGPEGRDNALGALIYTIQDKFIPKFGTGNYNALIDKGLVSLVLRIRGYNGTDNDDKLEVDLYTPAALGALNATDAGRSIPQWDGTDAWPIASDSLEALPDGDGGTTYSMNKPRFTDSQAYVSNGVFVANLPTADLRVAVAITDPPAEIKLTLTAAFLVGKIEKSSAGAWEVHDATLAGRWKSKDLVAELGQFPSQLDPSGQTPLCTNATDYPIFKQLVCSYVDIYSSLGTPASPCDSLSVGIQFQTGAAKLGNIYEVPTPLPRCDPAHDPKYDSCDTLLGDAGP